MKNIFYWTVRWICKLGLPFYFSKFEVNGAANIPKEGPVIFTPNHHNAFLDAILIGVLCKRPVYFLTRSDVFVPPYLWLLDALNMMPVYRRRDGFDKLSANEAIFQKCRDILKRGRCLLIFPEGNQADTHYLRPLTKGTSRLAFQAQQVNGHAIKIVPVGINYFNMFQPRRKMMVCFGKAIDVTEYEKDHQEHPARGLILLRDRISEGIKKCLLIPEKDLAYEEKVGALTPVNEGHRFDVLKEKIAAMQFDRMKYKPSFKWVIHLLSLANWLPLLIIARILKKKVRDPQFIGPLKFVMGMILFPLWWIFVFVLLYFTTGLHNAGVSTGLIIFCLFVRQELKNRVGPYRSIRG